MSRQPITPKTPPPPPAGPRPTGNPQPIVPKPNGGKPKGLLAELLAELLADVHYRYRVMVVPNLPRGLGVLRQRTSRLTGRTDYWWAWAVGRSPRWLPLPVHVADALPGCRDRAAVAELLERAR